MEIQIKKFLDQTGIEVDPERKFTSGFERVTLVGTATRNYSDYLDGVFEEMSNKIDGYNFL